MAGKITFTPNGPSILFQEESTQHPLLKDTAIKLMPRGPAGRNLALTFVMNWAVPTDGKSQKDAKALIACVMARENFVKYMTGSFRQIGAALRQGAGGSLLEPRPPEDRRRHGQAGPSGRLAGPDDAGGGRGRGENGYDHGRREKVATGAMRASPAVAPVAIGQRSLTERSRSDRCPVIRASASLSSTRVIIGEHVARDDLGRRRRRRARPADRMALLDRVDDDLPGGRVPVGILLRLGEERHHLAERSRHVLHENSRGPSRTR